MVHVASHLSVAIALFGAAAYAQSPCFEPNTAYSLQISNRCAVGGDFDGDGDFDIAATNYSNLTFGVSVNLGDGSFALPVAFPVGSSPIGIAAGDVDGDGHVDCAVTSELGEKVYLLLNDGGGGGGLGFAAPVPYQVGAGPRAVAFGDVDGDLDLDLAVVSAGAAVVSILRNDGHGVFGLAQPYAAGNFPCALVLDDLDGDGDLDLAVADRDNRFVRILRNDGSGAFGAQVPYFCGQTPFAVCAADLDGDGDKDLAVTLGDFRTSILENDGNASFTAVASLVGGREAIVAADFDLDGDIDLAASQAHFVAVIENHGDATFEAPVVHATGSDSNSIIAGDLDEDGDLDLAGVGFGSFLNTLRNCRNAGAPYCFGDGSSGACPCANAGASGHGCANSIFAAGARLSGTGSARVSDDTVLLRCDAATGSSLYFQGTGRTDLPFDDGKLCLDGALVRIGLMSVDATGASTNPLGGDTSISVKGGVPTSGGARTYQVVYRNANPSFCTPATTNRSNGIAITWRP
ncbi:MAG: FG-GAP repeat domain-containing protein [Planctomycetota bacterium]